MWKKGLLLGGFLAAAVGAVTWLKPTPTNVLAGHIDVKTAEASPATAGTAMQAASGSWIPPVINYASYTSAYGPLPHSLVGTQIPLFLQIDEQGRLTVTETLRELFDYFFKTDGEEPRDKITARVRELLNTLPSPAREQASQILEHYISLKSKEVELQKQQEEDFKASGRPPDLAERMRLVRELRAAQLDDETYQAFYGDQDKRDDYAIKRMEIMRDAALNPQQREAALDAIEQNLPTVDRAVRHDERETEQLDAHVAEARAAGASDAAIFQLREAAFGAETAQRYAQADQTQSQWDGRIASYREQRAAILNSAALSDTDKTSQIENVQKRLFDELEQKRIPVIDRMMDSVKK